MEGDVWVLMDPKNPAATEVVVGYEIDDRDRRWPIIWPAGEYVAGKSDNVGGFHGYTVTDFRGADGRQVELKGHQWGALRDAGMFRRRKVVA